MPQIFRAGRRFASAAKLRLAGAAEKKMRSSFAEFLNPNFGHSPQYTTSALRRAWTVFRIALLTAVLALGSGAYGQVVKIPPTIGPPSLGAPSLGAPSLGAPSLGAPSLGAPSLGAPSLGAPSLGAPSPVEQTPPSASGGSGEYEYAPFVVPAFCATVPVEVLKRGCDVVDAVRLGWELTDASGRMKSLDEVTRLLADAAAPDVIVAVVFPSQAALAEKIELVQSIYSAEIAFFQHLQNQIQTTMIENPTTQAQRKAAAIASSADYVALTRKATAEARQVGMQVENYIRSEPDTSRFQAHCGTACGQLIHIARTGSGFD